MMILNTVSKIPHKGEPEHNRRVVCESCADAITAFLDTYEEPPAPARRDGRTLAEATEATEAE
jgi:hypothetical protein